MKKSWNSFLLSLRKKILYPLASRVITGALRIILKTCKITIVGQENLQTTGQPRILMLWHNQMALVLNTLEKYALKSIIYTLIISNSKDADILASLVARYPENGKVLRVAHNSRHQAALEMVESLKKGEVMIITPDGPRGPKYVAKKGIAFAAKMAEAEIVPLAWSSSKFWQLSTWDKFIIPKPFSKIHVIIGDVIPHIAHTSLELPLAAKVLQEKLNTLRKKACAEIESNENLWPL